MRKIILFVICFLICKVSFIFGDSNQCGSLSMQDCISTKGCFLDCELKSKMHCGPYICREAKNKCESSYTQSELSKDKCLAIGECSYSQASCFCPGPMECYCGGGPPAMCKNAE